MNIINRIKSATPEIRGALDEYRRAENLSTTALARQLGSTSSQVSRYLNDKFEGDLEKFESKAQDVLRSAPLRKLVREETFETGVVRAVHGAIQGILETNDFAVIHGPAGIGKTIAAARYHARNPTSFLLTLSQDANNAHFIRRQLFAGLRTRSYSSASGTHIEWITARLTGSNRPIIVDNAHRATASGRRFLFDLHDQTGCPVVLIGNPEILDSIKTNDQQFSRVGMCPPEIALDPAEIPAIAERILGQDIPEHAGLLADYAVTVASRRGHLRALRKQIRLASYFIGRGEEDPRAAFRAAHAALVRDYSL